MANQGVGNTALGAAVCRLIEQYEPRQTRLFDDPLVKDLVGPLIRVMMQFAGMRNYTIKRTDEVAKGIYGAQICRTRFIDDTAQAALSQGIGQLLILGAGLDTRPYRLPGMERVQTFEVDLPTVQNDKKKKIQLEPSTIQAYLHPFHLALLADVGNTYYQEKYLQPLKRNLTVSEIERTVQAVVVRP